MCWMWLVTGLIVGGMLGMVVMAILFMANPPAVEGREEGLGTDSSINSNQ